MAIFPKTARYINIYIAYFKQTSLSTYILKSGYHLPIYNIIYCITL